MFANHKGSTIQDLRKQVNALAAELADLTEDAADRVSDQFAATTRQVRKSGRRARAAATGAVRENPLSAVGAAAGLGILFGFLIGLYSRR